jgi:CheY-like chemotaxis protein
MTEQATLLIVDNDPDILEQLAFILKGDGHRVVQAEGRDQAEEVLLSVRPDLAILDVMMEEMDSGFVLAHHLAKLYPDTLVIMLTGATATTGMSFASQFPEARSWLHTALVLDKPVRAEELRAHVRRLPRARRAAPAPPDADGT